MIQSILEFRETIVREVMIPRTEIVAIRSDFPIEEITRTVAEHGHTRIPVYQDSIDNIIGILNVKDLLKYWSRRITEAELISLLRKPYYIPETKNIHLLLSELKYRKYHMAIVIDEYGGTSGLVTLEDLLEEIVGEIQDEHDIAEQPITPLPDGSVLVDSRIEIEKIEEYFDIRIPEGKFETLAGFILHLIKRIPSAGEAVSYENLEMTIDSADDRSIKKVKIRKKTEEVRPAI
jgi:CBS domain containing-hemolysin-like protein